MIPQGLRLHEALAGFEVNGLVQETGASVQNGRGQDFRETLPELSLRMRGSTTVEREGGQSTVSLSIVVVYHIRV